VVSERLGHADEASRLQLYAKVSSDKTREALNRPDESLDH
jgi:hypothetical protein